MTIETPVYLRRSVDTAVDKTVLLPELPPGFAYPDHYEVTVELPGVGPLIVRPIRKDDAPLFEALFKSLTPRSVYLRFFTILRQLPPAMLARFTQIDYAHEIALVALIDDNGLQTMVGDARVIETGEAGGAEFSVMVKDPWQGKGIGACLLHHCLAISQRRGYRHVHGIVLPDNRQMLALGRKLGFTIRREPSGAEFKLSKAFDEDTMDHTGGGS
ncbi:MAG: GNAT family N-acetyltransferase [Desulfatitalea sp.]|nr:GNAT family N-acetyltransferase [Desulfatitalea sp.]